MIVVDSSALIEIVLDQADAEACVDALETAEQAFISAATVTECLIVAMGHEAERPLLDLFDRFGLNVVPVTDARARAAARGYRRYGRKWHAAGLNFGDSFAYALAMEFTLPLLFVGNDFPLTNVTPVFQRVRPIGG